MNKIIQKSIKYAYLSIYVSVYLNIYIFSRHIHSHTTQYAHIFMDKW